MLKLRPYTSADAAIILSWCRDEKSFYQWSAGVLGEFPITEKEFRFVEGLMPFVAFDESGAAGFFTLRRPDPQQNVLRFGFVIVDPMKRGKGYGKRMLQMGLEYAFIDYGAEKVSLGVFENNPAAYYCYKSVGFFDVVSDKTESYKILDEEWKCRELALQDKQYQKG